MAKRKKVGDKKKGPKDRTLWNTSSDWKLVWFERFKMDELSAAREVRFGTNPRVCWCCLWKLVCQGVYDERWCQSTTLTLPGQGSWPRGVYSRLCRLLQALWKNWQKLCCGGFCFGEPFTFIAWHRGLGEGFRPRNSNLGSRFLPHIVQVCAGSRVWAACIILTSTSSLSELRVMDSSPTSSPTITPCLDAGWVRACWCNNGELAPAGMVFPWVQYSPLTAWGWGTATPIIEIDALPFMERKPGILGLLRRCPAWGTQNTRSVYLPSRSCFRMCTISAVPCSCPWLGQVQGNQVLWQKIIILQWRTDFHEFFHESLKY